MPIIYDHSAVGQRLPPETPLLRFMSLSKYLDLMTRQSLWLTQLGRFTDTHEGYPTSAAFRRSVDHWATQGLDHSTPFHGGLMEAEAMRQAAEYLRLTAMVSCWYSDRIEPAGVWDQYGTEGVAIVSSAERLETAVKDVPEQLLLGPVTYVDYQDDEWDWRNILRNAFHKRQNFAHEREVRLVYYRTDFDPQDELPGVHFETDLRELVDHVLVHPGARHWQVEAARAATQQLGFNWEVERSRILEPPMVPPLMK